MLEIVDLAKYKPVFYNNIQPEYIHVQLNSVLATDDNLYNYIYTFYKDNNPFFEYTGYNIYNELDQYYLYNKQTKSIEPLRTHDTLHVMYIYNNQKMNRIDDIINKIKLL